MTPSNSRPRRSVLFMPGANARALEKARGLRADGLILDLEDAVAPTAKIEARSQVLRALVEGGYGQREVMVRINRLDTPWGRDDVQALLGSKAAGRLAGLVLPKVESALEIQQLAELMTALARSPTRGDLDSNAVSIWAMIESPQGVVSCAEIARASPRLQVLVMGTNDLAKSLRVPKRHGRPGLVTALSWCVLAARLHGLDILDGVHANLADIAGFEHECEHGVALGFDGKTLIHPKQIEPCNRVFAPDSEAIEHARRVVEAWRTAQTAGKGVVVVDGEMIENLHVEQATAMLDKAAAIAALEH